MKSNKSINLTEELPYLLLLFWCWDTYCFIK